MVTGRERGRWARKERILRDTPRVHTSTVTTFDDGRLDARRGETQRTGTITGEGTDRHGPTPPQPKQATAFTASYAHNNASVHRKRR
eukprot:1798559-Prymnesium_polylepis.1